MVCVCLANGRMEGTATMVMVKMNADASHVERELDPSTMHDPDHCTCLKGKCCVPAPPPTNEGKSSTTPKEEEVQNKLVVSPPPFGWCCSSFSHLFGGGFGVEMMSPVGWCCLLFLPFGWCCCPPVLLLDGGAFSSSPFSFGAAWSAPSFGDAAFLLILWVALHFYSPLWHSSLFWSLFMFSKILSLTTVTTTKTRSEEKAAPPKKGKQHHTKGGWRLLH